MGRFLDFVVLLVALFGILIAQTAGAVILDELRNEFNENAAGDLDQTETNNSMFTSVTKWVPTVALLGAILFVLFREYRRQRITATRRRPR